MSDDLESGQAAAVEENGNEHSSRARDPVAAHVPPAASTAALPSASDLLQSQLSGENSPLLNYSSINSEEDEIAKHTKKLRKRLWIFGGLGLLALLILHLIFLPRTSLSRDFRRYHGMHWTKTDVKRNFLSYSGIGNSTNSFETQQSLNFWLGNFTTLGSQTTSNIVSSDNPELLEYVQKQFKAFGLATDSFNFDAEALQRPESSEIALLDHNKNIVYVSNVLEPNFDTPAFNGLGISGEIVAPFLYANEGTWDDYTLLLSNKFNIEGKIVILKSQLNSSISVAEKVILAESLGAVGVVNYFEIPSGEAKEYAVPRSTLSSGNSTKPSIISIPSNLKSLKPIFDTLKGSNDVQTFEKWDFYPTSSANGQLKLTTKFAAKPDRKLTNIVGRIDGLLNEGDIIIGSKRDSFTSSDPLSSHAVMFEVMRHFQTMKKNGWKPLRNIEFVSWDSSSNGLLGSQQLVDHTTILGSKKYGASSILAYINIDGNAVSGSKFHIDSNIMLNHVLKDTAQSVVMPNRPAFKNEKDKDYTTLHHYWQKQDNCTINNILGQQIVSSDALVFANHLNVPVVNVRFDHDPAEDKSTYVANSNYYSLEWLQDNDIDKDLLWHGSLFRFVGLLAISLSEHEVVNYKLSELAKLSHSSFEQLKSDNQNILDSWSSKGVSNLISETSIERDLLDKDGLTLKHLIKELEKLLSNSAKSTTTADEYNSHVQENLIQDHPWYNYYKKLGYYAQFKVTNFKLLRSNKQFSLDPKDLDYLGIEDKYYKNVLFGVPEFSTEKTQQKLDNRFRLSTWTGLREAIIAEDFELTVKWIAVIYDKVGYWR